MIRLLQGAAFALGLATVVPSAEAASHVKTLTAENFQKAVLESTDLWLIEFASPSQFILEENMDGLPRKVSKSGVRVGSMDCDDQTNLKICRLYGFRGSYALTGFFEKPEPNPYTKKNIRKYQPFSGSTTPKAIEKFLSKNCPDLIRLVGSAEELQGSVFDAPANAVVIFGEKENPTMYYKTLAVRFAKHALQFVYVQSNNAELMEAFPDITESPAVVVYADGEVVRYGEELTDRQELIEWLKEYAGDEIESKASQQSRNSDELVIKVKDLAGTEEFPMSQVIAVVNDNADEEVSEWSKAVEETDSAVEFRELRCGSEDHAHVLYSVLCSSDEAKIPYLLVLPYGPEQKQKTLKSPAKNIHPISSIEAAHKKAMDSIPNLVTVINSYDPPERMNQFLVEGVKSNRISILVFSDKTTPPSSLKGLAAAEAKHLQVGFVAEPSDQILGNFGWSRARGIPLVLGTYYSDGVREKQQHDTNWEKGPDAQEGEDVGFRVLYYEPDMLGPMRFTSLRVFSGSVFQKSGLTPVGSGGNGGTTTAKRQEAVDIINSEADWNAACPDSMMGICVVGFLNAPSDAAAADAYSMDAMALSILTDVMISTQKDSPAFHFVAGNIACLSAFGSQFGVDPFNTPGIAIYSPGKGRYAVYRGSFVEAEMRHFLGQVLRGGETTHAISRPVISEGIDCTVPPTDTFAESDALGDEDAEDFLAEIRREEQERAAQLEKELAEEKARQEAESKTGPTKKKKKSKKKKKATKKSEL